MSRLRLPQPPQGWTALGWEVSVVFLGIVLALGADQLVDRAYWKSQVQDFRKALAVEIATTLGTYEYRRRQNDCASSRLDELERWWNSWRNGRPQMLQGPIGLPLSLAHPSSVWASRTPDVVGHLPLQQRLLYARIYDEMANNNTHRLVERDAWIELSSYDGAKRLSESDLIRIRGLLNQLRLRQIWFGINHKRVAGYAAGLGIKPYMDQSWVKPSPDICRPIVADDVRSPLTKRNT